MNDEGEMTADRTPVVLDGRRRRWQEHNQTRRQTIIDAAVTVLERQAPGEEVQVQAVADEANMSRTVIYRHFEDRADLDRAVQRQACRDLGAHLLPALTYEGRAEDIIRQIIEAFVGWASEHPTLYWFAERDLSGWGPNPFAEALEGLAAQIEEIMETVVRSLGAELDPKDRAGLDPWVFGMIGAVSGALRRWLNREVREPDTETFISILSETVWLQINGMATSRGINLPDLPVAELLQGFAPSEG